MHPRIYIPYSLILKEKLIHEADILQYRHNGIISKFIRTFTEGEHTHSSIASWNGEIIECVEFREWSGGRSVNLKHVIDINPTGIDVYRVSSPITKMKMKFKGNIIPDGPQVVESLKDIEFQTETVEFDGKKISNCMRKLTGLPYGYMRIWRIAQIKLPVLRFFVKIDVDDEQDSDNVYPVCSSVIAHCFRRNYVDLMHARPDNKTSPADLSRSPLTNYLFTIYKD